MTWVPCRLHRRWAACAPRPPASNDAVQGLRRQAPEMHVAEELSQRLPFLSPCTWHCGTPLGPGHRRAHGTVDGDGEGRGHRARWELGEASSPRTKSCHTGGKLQEGNE